MTAMTSDDHITGAQIGNPNERLQPAPHTNMKEGKRTVTSEMTDGVNQNSKPGCMDQDGVALHPTCMHVHCQWARQREYGGRRSISVRTTVIPTVTRFVRSECEAELSNEDR
jgi:hypothetical protein